MKKKILIFGGSGLVGSTFIDYGKDTFDISYTYNTNDLKIDYVKSFKINFLSDGKKISNIIKEYNPDVIIHMVAFPSVDFCEENHQLATELHVNATKKIVEQASINKSKLIFLSTDAVFGGKLNKKYTEDDLTNPVNYYGVTKLNAEKIVLENPTNIVVRTSVIYGWHDKSRFTNWILDSLKQNKIVDPFIDQFNCPTLVDDLAKSLIKMIDLDISGLFHASGKTCINRYDFAVKLSKKFEYDENLIIPVTSKEKKQEAPRPNSTCLDSSKLEETIDFEFSTLDEGISFILDKSRGF
ncbi:MAG: SDR family oxidoreductase [Nitrosopumilus sp.]|nr:SDR family oxidoreductase [Nitrosopumilus sp.]